MSAAGVDGRAGASVTPEELFTGNPTAKAVFDAVARAVEQIGPATVRVSKSQVAFRRKRNFAVLWMPGKYLRGKVAPVVLTLSFPGADRSSRWKEIVQVGPRRFTHHLEIREVGEVDDQVRHWLQAAWEAS